MESRFFFAAKTTEQIGLILYDMLDVTYLVKKMDRQGLSL